MHLLTEILLGLIEGSEYHAWHIGTDRLSVPTRDGGGYYVYIDEGEFRCGGLLPSIKYNIADPSFKPEWAVAVINRKMVKYYKGHPNDDFAL